MGQLKHVQDQLEFAFAGYLELDEGEQDSVIDMTLLLLRQMLRDKSGRRQKLTELEADTKPATEKNRTQTTSANARNKLVRKTNSVSPQSPNKPVQVTKKNELRRK